MALREVLQVFPTLTHGRAHRITLPERPGLTWTRGFVNAPGHPCVWNPSLAVDSLLLLTRTQGHAREGHRAR